MTFSRFFCYSLCILAMCIFLAACGLERKRATPLKAKPVAELVEEKATNNTPIPRPDPGFVQQMEKQSMLANSVDMAKIVSGSHLGWSTSPTDTSPIGIMDYADAWVFINPSMLLVDSRQDTFSYMSNTRFWATLREAGIKGVFVSPTSGSGRLWSTDAYDNGGEDAVVFDFADTVGSEKSYGSFITKAIDSTAIIGSDIIPAATGIGPDFYLSLRNVREYPGIYCLVEVPKNLWSILPSVTNEWQGVEVPRSAIETLKNEGLLPAHLLTEDDVPTKTLSTSSVFKSVVTPSTKLALNNTFDNHKALITSAGPVPSEPVEEAASGYVITYEAPVSHIDSTVNKLMGIPDPPPQRVMVPIKHIPPTASAQQAPVVAKPIVVEPEPLPAPIVIPVETAPAPVVIPVETAPAPVVTAPVVAKPIVVEPEPLPAPLIIPVETAPAPVVTAPVAAKPIVVEPEPLPAPLIIPVETAPAPIVTPISPASDAPVITSVEPAPQGIPVVSLEDQAGSADSGFALPPVVLTDGSEETEALLPVVSPQPGQTQETTPEPATKSEIEITSQPLSPRTPPKKPVDSVGWAATAETVGIDASVRRWVYRYYENPSQAVLNWDDPSRAASRILSGSTVRQVGMLGQSLIGLKFDAFHSLGTRSGYSRLGPAMAATQSISREIKRYGAWSWERDKNLTINEMRLMLSSGADFVTDHAFSPAAEHALLTGDATLARYMADKLIASNIETHRLVHTTPMHDGISYELLDLQGDSKAGGLVGHVQGEVKAKLGSAMQGNTLYTTSVGLAAAALGVTPEAIPAKSANTVAQGHHLLVFFKAMQPGLIMLSGQDLVGAMPLSPSKMSSGFDASFASKGSYSLTLVNSVSATSSQAIAKTDNLYAPTDEQVHSKNSFLNSLGDMLKKRSQTKVSKGQLVARPETKGAGSIALLTKLPDGSHMLSVCNFARTATTENLSLSINVNSITAIAGTRSATANGRNISVSLGAWQSTAIIIK